MVGPADVDAHMPGEALPVTTAAPTPTENTVGIELTSATEGATVAEVLSTEPRAEGERTWSRDAASKGHERGQRCAQNAAMRG